MLLSREEMAFDFHGAKLDPIADKDVIVWAVQQFLYGEITGIQVGHWIYNAPDLASARFLARQAVEEFQHVGNFLRILEILRAKPAKAASPVRFLATGLMGNDWAEHVALEMALGEGLVLQAFYAMICAVDEEEVVAILQRGVKQEERHVEFGEQQTTKVIQGRPWLRRRLLGLALVSLWGVSRLEVLMKRRLPMDHPALKQLPDLVRHSVRMAEVRLMRIGLVDRPLSSISGARKLAYVLEAYGGKLLGALFDFVLSIVLFPLRLFGLFRPKRLTETYLDDPLVRGHRAGSGEGDEPDDAREESRARSATLDKRLQEDPSALPKANA
jgi:hypothetical protein